MRQMHFNECHSPGRGNAEGSRKGNAVLRKRLARAECTGLHKACSLLAAKTERNEMKPTPTEIKIRIRSIEYFMRSCSRMGWLDIFDALEGVKKDLKEMLNETTTD